MQFSLRARIQRQLSCCNNQSVRRRLHREKVPCLNRSRQENDESENRPEPQVPPITFQHQHGVTPSARLYFLRFESLCYYLRDTYTDLRMQKNQYTIDSSRCIYFVRQKNVYQEKLLTGALFEVRSGYFLSNPYPVRIRNSDAPLLG